MIDNELIMFFLLLLQKQLLRIFSCLKSGCIVEKAVVLGTELQSKDRNCPSTENANLFCEIFFFFNQFHQSYRMVFSRKKGGEKKLNRIFSSEPLGATLTGTWSSSPSSGPSPAVSTTWPITRKPPVTCFQTWRRGLFTAYGKALGWRTWLLWMQSWSLQLDLFCKYFWTLNGAVYFVAIFKK